MLRALRIIDGHVVLMCTYHKMRAAQGHDLVIPHFLFSDSQHNGPSYLAQSLRKGHEARFSLPIPLHVGCLG